MTAAVDREYDDHATLTGVIDTVYTQPVGSVLAADATTGDSTVTVDDMADFDEEIGGTLSIGGTTSTYTVTDADTGGLTLGTTLTADAAEGDRVNVWDTGLDRAAVETRAQVALPGSQANDDYIDATVAQALAVQLEVGMRDPGTGESVTVVQRGLEWTVTDIRGKQPQIQPAYAAVGNAIEAFGFFTASDPSAFDGSEFRVPIDTIDTLSTTPGFFTLSGDANFEVIVAEDGAYQCAVWLNPFGANGDVIRALIEAGASLLGEPTGYGIADADTGTAQITVSTEVHVCTAGTTFAINLKAITGSGPFGVSQARMTIVKFAGTYT